MKALFYEPFEGFTQNGDNLVNGVGRGLMKFASSTGGGVLNSTSKITGSLGNGIAALTMDEDYLNKRQRNAKKATGIGDGLVQGTSNLTSGIVDGVSGVVLDPLRGAKQEGVMGFTKGLGKGVVGLFGKSAAGVADFVANTTEGVTSTITGYEEKKRLRKVRIYCNEIGMRGWITKQYIECNTHEEFIKLLFKNNNQDFTYIDGNYLVVVGQDRALIFEYSQLHLVDGVFGNDIKSTSSGVDGVTITLKNNRILFIRNKSVTTNLMLSNKIDKIKGAPVKPLNSSTEPKQEPKKEEKKRFSLNPFAKKPADTSAPATKPEVKQEPKKEERKESPKQEEKKRFSLNPFAKKTTDNTTEAKKPADTNAPDAKKTKKFGLF